MMASVIYRAPDSSAWRLEGKANPWRQRVCRVLAEGRGPGPHNLLLEFEDGSRIVTVHRRRSVRPLRKSEQQAELF
jgi:hypothetical protein